VNCYLGQTSCPHCDLLGHERPEAWMCPRSGAVSAERATYVAVTSRKSQRRRHVFCHPSKWRESSTGSSLACPQLPPDHLARINHEDTGRHGSPLLRSEAVKTFG